MTPHSEVLDLLTIAQQAVQTQAPDDTVVTDLLRGLSDVLSNHGPAVANTMIALYPLALARGDSKKQLMRVARRFEEGEPGGVAAWLDPAQKRNGQSEVIDTGSINFTYMAGMSSLRRTP